MYGAEDAERTDEDEPLERHVQLEQRLNEVLCAEGVGAEEVVAVDTLGSASGMHHILKLMATHLLYEPIL